MKLIFKILTICLIITLVACKNESPEVKTVEIEQTATLKTPDNPYKDYAKLEFNIEGMTCAMGCAKTIEKKIAKLDGVHFVNVDFDKKLAMVEYDDKKLSPDNFTQTVTKVSDTYKVGEIKTVNIFSKDKKTCAKDCKKACCKDKTEAEKKDCKKNCKNKTEAEKKACKKACSIKTV